jgi:glutaminase
MSLPLQDYLESLHQRFAGLREGAVASYIPELAKANADSFGICLVATDGFAYAVGDSEQRFTIQSISKPFVYAAALADRGRDLMRAKVGVEPSGDAFNSISLDPRTGAPVNPMINAGAIATTSLVGGADAEAQWQRIVAALSLFAGRPLTVDQAVYASESDSGFRNRAIAWMLRNAGISQGDPMPALENYFRQCALQVSCRDLACMAATLANGGIHPLTGERAASAEDVEAVLSVMSTCGMYDYAGSWLYEIGMPAKSGVGGGVIAVLPGRFGIAVFSPPLDEIGNSARGIAVCRQFSRDFGLHVFGPSNAPGMALNRIYSGADAPSRRSRPAAEQALLASRPLAIRYLELQGELALDGADYISRRLAELATDSQYFILDLHRLSRLTPSAARLLLQSRRQLAASGQSLILARLRGKPALQEALQQALPAGEPAWMLYDDNEQAVEWCENQLLAELGAGAASAPALTSAQQFALFANLGAITLGYLEGILRNVVQPAGSILMTAGVEDDDRLFLILQGEVSVLLPLPDGGSQRVATLGPGALFGEMVLLGQRRRMATVQAEQEVRCLSLSAADLDNLARDFPQVKIQVLQNLALELAGKLRQANQLIGALAA